MMLFNYPTKKALKEAIGQNLCYTETFLFAPEYVASGSITGAHAGPYQGNVREYFATVTLKNNKIVKVV